MPDFDERFTEFFNPEKGPGGKIVAGVVLIVVAGVLAAFIFG